HGVGMLVDLLLVQRVDLGGFGLASGRADLLGNLLEAPPGPPGEVDPGALSGEGAGHRPADRSPASVDHRVLLLEEHPRPPFGCGPFTITAREARDSTPCETSRHPFARAAGEEQSLNHRPSCGEYSSRESVEVASHCWEVALDEKQYCCFAWK